MDWMGFRYAYNIQESFFPKEEGRGEGEIDGGHFMSTGIHKNSSLCMQKLNLNI